MAWTANWRRSLLSYGRSRDETGEAVTELTDGTLYEVRITVADGGELDLSDVEKEIKVSCVLGE